MTTQVLQSQSSHFPSPSTSTTTSTSATSVVPISCSLSSPHNDHVPPHQHHLHHTTIINNTTPSSSVDVLMQQVQQQEEEEQVGLKNNNTGRGGERNNREEEVEEEREEEGDQLSLLALLVTVFRKSLVVGGCSYSERDRDQIFSKMEIGSPRNVRHVAHVTFDRFNGFLGLPDEFEPDVPRKPPSASATVFGVSTESMQLSFDSRGNSVPTILLMMQRRLYAKGGLQAEGIFRINADNTQEEYVREQLNKGVIPDSVDVHSLAGLIKAWFRELPKGVLDPLSPEQVMQSESEEECAELVGLLPSAEAALLDWAINLMADVAQLENLNKMSPRNVAMVFAPNMTQMSDPLTALMYVVQVMNFLRTLITKTLREREDSIVEKPPASRIEPSDENGHGSSSLRFAKEANEMADDKHVFAAEEPALESPSHSSRYDSTPKSGAAKFLTSIENIITDGNEFSVDNCRHEAPAQLSPFLTNGLEENDVNSSNETAEKNYCEFIETAEKNYCEFIPGQSRKKGSKKANERGVFRATGSTQKTKGTGNDNRTNSRSERIESWR